MHLVLICPIIKIYLCHEKLVLHLEAFRLPVGFYLLSLLHTSFFVGFNLQYIITAVLRHRE